MAGLNLNRSLDDIIEERGFGKAPRGGYGAGGGNTGRSQPYNARSQQRDGGQLIGDQLDQNVEFPKNSIKVGGQANPKEIAERVVAACRTGEMPALLTIGNASINQAVKAIAIARADLEQQGTELSFQPAFRHADRTKPLIAFYLSQEPRRGQGLLHSGAAEVQLTVTAAGKIAPVAGAIAGKTRDGQRVALAAIGVDAVTNAVLAVGNARLFLEQDALDIKVLPAFEKVEKNGNELTSLSLHVVAERL